MKINQKTPEKKQDSGSQYEDAILKTSMQFFADELLSCLGISGKVTSFAPTELVQLELHKFYQDFTLVMDDGSWKHFEFQSKNPGLIGLKRFRVYEAMASYQHNVAVRTYVLYSGRIRNPMTKFTEGINSFQITPIILRGKNGDRFISKLLRMLKKGKLPSRKDLILLTLCPLMGGFMPQKERIRSALTIVRAAGNAPDSLLQEEEQKKIEAMLYAMAEKFVDAVDFSEIKEEFLMTKLGQFLYDEWTSQARQEAWQEAWQEAQQEEKINTEREKARADAAEKELQVLRKELQKLRNLAG